MRILLGVALPLMGVAISACTRPVNNAPDPFIDPQPDRGDDTLGMQLNDVQLDCRVRRNIDLAQLDHAFGPTCAKQPTMPMTISTFDLGTLEGYAEARDHATAEARLCVCAKTDRCDDAQKSKVMDAVQRVEIDNDGRREREGAARIMSGGNASCFNAAIGTEIWLAGFRCAALNGSLSRSIREERMKWYRIATDSEDDAIALDLECAKR